jgi:hypothetical protein
VYDRCTNLEKQAQAKYSWQRKPNDRSPTSRTTAKVRRIVETKALRLSTIREIRLGPGIEDREVGLDESFTSRSPTSAAFAVRSAASHPAKEQPAVAPVLSCSFSCCNYSAGRTPRYRTTRLAQDFIESDTSHEAIQSMVEECWHSVASSFRVCRRRQPSD